MEITTDYGNGQRQNINTTATEKQSSADGADSSARLARHADGGKLSGQIVELANKETPPLMTIKLSSGELIKGSAQPPIPTEAKVGEQIRFTATALEGKVHIQNIETEASGGGDAQKLAMMKSALDMAGLKPTENNMKLVSLLLERELPINKESLQTISKMVRSTGVENAEKAAVLMKNNIAPTIGAMERLDRYASGGQLMKQMTSLAESVAEMGEGPLKQKLLQALSGLMPENGRTGGNVNLSSGASAGSANSANQANTGNPALMGNGGLTGAENTNQASLNDTDRANTNHATGAQADGANPPATNIRQATGQLTPEGKLIQALQETAQNIQNTTEPPNTALEHKFSEAGQLLRSTDDDALFTETDHRSQTMNETAGISAQTGTKLFRDIFIGRQEAYAQLSKHPPSAETARFINENIEPLKEGFASLIEKGAITKESVEELAKSVIGKEKLPFDLENENQLKSFILSVAQKSGQLEESLEKAGQFRENVDRTAKKIIEGLSLLLDDKDSAEKLERAIDNIKEKLGAAAKELGSGDESIKVKQSVEDIKENLKFLSNLKDTPFIEVPVFIDGQQKHADLYVFSRKGGKVKGGGSQSALLALDLANLGHFETYIQKNGRSVSCQFRHDNDEAETVVRENMEKLTTALKNKRYSLDFVSFKKTGESFSITNTEPDLDEHKAKKELFSIDYKA